jgi:hypothetical protein
MRARQAVLLTPSKSSYPCPLLSYKQIAPVSPLFATLTKSAYLYHSTAFSRPLFSYSYALFCIHQKLNSFLFMRFRTLSPKQGGVGWRASFPSRLSDLLGAGCVPSQNGSPFSPPLLFLSTFNFQLSTSPTSHQSLFTGLPRPGRGHLLIESPQQPFKESPNV